MPAWTAPMGINTCSTTRTMVYAVRKDPTEHPIDSRWGLRFNKVHADGQVDAAWNRGDVYFLSRGDRYLMYSHGLDWADDAGERSTGNNGKEDGVPGGSIDAAFTDKANTTWFFQGSKYVSVDSNKTFSNAADIKDRWGSGAQRVHVAQTRRCRGGWGIQPRRAELPDRAGFLHHVLRSRGDVVHPASRSRCAPFSSSSNAAIPATSMPASSSWARGRSVRNCCSRPVAAREARSTASRTKRSAVAKPEPTPGPWQDIASFMYGGSRFALTSRSKAASPSTVSGSSEKRGIRTIFRRRCWPATGTSTSSAWTATCVQSGRDQRGRYRQCHRSVGVRSAAIAGPLGPRGNVFTRAGR